MEYLKRGKVGRRGMLYSQTYTFLPIAGFILFPAGYEIYRKVKMKLLILIKCLSLHIYHVIDKHSLGDKKES